MLNDKHIEQWASYLVEEIENDDKVIREMRQEMWDVFVKMYKKGYEDALEDKMLILHHLLQDEHGNLDWELLEDIKNLEMGE